MATTTIRDHHIEAKRLFKQGKVQDSLTYIQKNMIEAFKQDTLAYLESLMLNARLRLEIGEFMQASTSMEEAY